MNREIREGFFASNIYIRSMKNKILYLIAWAFFYYIYRDVLGNFSGKYSFFEIIQSLLNNPRSLALTLSSFFVQILASIFAYYILLYTIPKKKYVQTFLLFIGMFIVLSGIRYTIDEVIIFNIYGQGNYFGNFSLFYYWFDNTYYTSAFALIGSIYFFYHYSIFKEKKNQELILENKKTELSFLKAQINPHFIFNSLNNLYSLIYHESNQALPYVSKLSNLIRFSLYESDEKIALGKELEYIHDYLELEKMRMVDDIDLDVQIDEGLKPYKIHPFIIIPFVENAIKHGHLTDTNHPIQIHIKKNEKDLVVFVKNKIKEKEKDKVGGIGLLNVKKRLDLMYENQYTLEMKKNDSFYTVHLKINNIC